MSTTLSYGFKKPTTGDKGGGATGWFKQLEDDITQLNGHTHNGSNSAPLSTASVIGTRQTILSAASGGWVLVANGIYSKTVTMPAGLLYTQVSIEIQSGVAATGGAKIFLQTEPTASTNEVKVYSNDNTLDMTLVYSS